MKHHKESGAVSLFVVIFASLLLTIVTVSFVQLMIKDQQQATSSDLSQSAYDSAQAGVEDAKRLLLLEQACQNGTAAASVNCGTITAALTPVAGQPETACDTLAKSGLVGETNNETIIQQSDTDNAAKLDQAYTCVKVKVDTEDYLDNVAVNQSTLIPLQGVGEFDSVVVKWFSSSDISAQTNDKTIGFPSVGPGGLPPIGDKWKFNYPSLLRTQFIQLGSSFKLGDFDDSQPGNKSDANTLFLYPSKTGIKDQNFALDARRSSLNAPYQAACVDSFVASEFACSVTIKLSTPIDGSASRNAYLRLTPLYNGAHFSVALKRGGEDVKFDRVQPQIDSTGRASDMFRRVIARVKLSGNFTAPEAAIDINGNLCKNFTITDQDSGFKGSATCSP